MNNLRLSLLVFALAGCAHIPVHPIQDDREILVAAVRYLETAPATHEIQEAFNRTSHAWVFPLSCTEYPDGECSFPEELAQALESKNRRHVSIGFIQSRFQPVPFKAVSGRTLAVSRPGLAPDRRTAAVAVAIWNRDGCSNGFVLFMRRSETGWIVERLGDHWAT